MSTEADDPRGPRAPRYDHAEIEPRWQRYWEEHRSFEAKRRPGNKKRYILDMFPYPSGSGLHVGHPEGYTATDIVSRFARMHGEDVLHPMGWDAFGLPAEQYAIEHGTPPAETTNANIATFRRQLKMLGFSYDWSRELATTDPEYVRWTQWIFLKLYHRGLAYQDEVPVNWCAALGTVLANEEVIDGKSERGNHPVVRTPLRQWMLKITAYADRLAKDLDTLDWPHGTVTMQRDWIGRSEGAEIRFAVEGHPGADFAVFTTRPDTLMGCTYVVLAPEHALVKQITTADARAKVDAYVAETARKSDRDRIAETKTKTGVPTGAFALHPITGARVPIWVADYVIGGYGTGAVMAVPAHDTRDFAFAKAFDLPIVEVVSPDGKAHGPLSEPFVDDGINVASGELDGLRTSDAKKKMIELLAARDRGGSRVTYKLRDWVFSRQRYWGEPIPIYFPVDLPEGGDPKKGAKAVIRYDQPIPVAESELPLELPITNDYKPGDDPAGPLARALDWRFFQKDGKWYARETNTMPQWAGSCWYYLRFLDPRNAEQGWSKEAHDAWMPVDLYVGGGEHAVLHLLYARFWHKVLFDEGVVSHPEPFQKLVHQGMILGETEYTHFATADGTKVSAADAKEVEDGFVRATDDVKITEVRVGEEDVEKRGPFFWLKGAEGIRIQAMAHKMSKSRKNVVNPDDIVKAHGADALRLYEMFMGPLEAVKPWQSSQIQGVVRFRDRVYQLAKKPVVDAIDDETKRLLHKTIKKVSHDIEALAFNTAISTMMVFTNHLHGLKDTPREAVTALALLVAPFAPHLGEEMWSLLGNEASLAHGPWPTWDDAFAVDDTIEMAVQVNGKVRGRVVLSRTASEADAKAAAYAAEGVGAFTDGKTLKKFVYVPGKIVNLVVG
ncbi:MAG: leucine--tRNA ligase [Polyangiaceae bacterium]